MKYWIGKTGTSKEGQCGTMDDTGATVPDSDETTKQIYDAWVAAQPVVVIPDYKALYTAASTDSQRINVIAQALKLV